MQELINSIWRDVLREPVMAIVMAVFVPYIVALAQRQLSKIGLEQNQLLRDAIHKAAENGVNLAMAQGETVFGNVTSGAVDYVKRMSPKALKRLKVDDSALIDIVQSKIGKKINPNP